MPPAEQGLERPPYSIRCRVLTPLDDGRTSFVDDALVRVGSAGRFEHVGEWRDLAGGEAAIDLRPWLLLPGLIDLHAHLPQLPSAGLGAGMDLLSWLARYVFPLEREFRAEVAARVAPAAFRAFAGAGTTTAVLYGAVYADSMDASFQAAEEHGLRVVMGKVMMDRLRYDTSVSDAEVLDVSLRQSADLISRWHGRDGGRLRYAVTPRFAVSCSAQMLRESADLARSTGTYWQTHLAEDRHEIERVRELFPGTADYTDVYDRAGGLSTSALLAHSIHLSEREIGRLVETGSNIAHCPSSNLFLTSGTMPLAHYLQAGLRVGLGSDVAGGPEVSLFSVMRAGAFAQSALRAARGDDHPSMSPLDWLRLGTLDGARALGQQAQIGSLEAGKEADFIAVDPDVTAPLPGSGVEEPAEIVSRLIFRGRPDMIRGAWVRGRRLAAEA